MLRSNHCRVCGTLKVARFEDEYKSVECIVNSDCYHKWSNVPDMKITTVWCQECGITYHPESI